MKQLSKPLYVASLRLKAGEMQGLNALSGDIADYFLPHMIAMPRKERDDDGQESFVADDGAVPVDGTTLARSWFGRRALLNPVHLFRDFDEERSGLWLPKMYENARSAGLIVTPVAAFDDLEGSRRQAFKDSLNHADEIVLALRVHYSSVDDPAMKDRLIQRLDETGVSPESCMVLVDFTDADFSNSEIVSGVIENAYEQLETMARWHGVALEGTSYPEKNRAPHSGEILEPRNEWKAWISAVNYNESTPDYVLFGDYAADCARMTFGKMGAAAIRHHRYTTEDSWLNVRGSESGSNQPVMRDVCRRVLASPHFAGRTFSWADDQIYRIAREGANAGSPKDWRAINTNHHITRVMRDLGRIKGVVFGDRAVPPPREQLELI